MYASFEKPTLDEGFNKIYFYYPDSVTKYIIYEEKESEAR